MSQESSHDFKFKRDLSHVFDSVHSYHLRNKCKKRNKLIRVYTGYITSTGIRRDGAFGNNPRR